MMTNVLAKTAMNFCFSYMNHLLSMRLLAVPLLD